jgi:hypothetical protein
MITWLEEAFNSNRPWDKIVSDIVTATGTQDKNGAVTFYVANPTADKMTDQVARLFLGVQLQCAQCHNHPFTDWKQKEYWGMATFFTKVRTDRANAAARNGTSPGVQEIARGRGNRLPESAMNVPAKFLQDEEPKLDAAEPYRPALAAWMTSKTNPFFARAMANRMWHTFFGRGIVNPADDMSADKLPSHPELLQTLADQFVASGFDLKYLVRAICNSQAYQRTSKPVSGNVEADASLFSRMAVKVLTPEQLYDSLTMVAGRLENNARPNRAIPNANTPRAQFVAFFQVEDGADPTEYQAGIPQALRLMNSPQLNRGSPLVTQAVRSGQKPAEVIETLYLSTLSRRPSKAESDRLLAYVEDHKTDPAGAYGDILWSLVNCSEFALNH